MGIKQTLRKYVTVNALLKVYGCLTLFQYGKQLLFPPYDVRGEHVERASMANVKHYLYCDFSVKLVYIIITCFMLRTIFELPSPVLVTINGTETLSWEPPSPHWVVLWIISSLVVCLLETSLLQPVLTSHKNTSLQWYPLVWRVVDLSAGVAAWVYYKRAVTNIPLKE